MKRILFLLSIILIAGCSINQNVVKEYVIYEENKEPILCFTPDDDCGRVLEEYIKNATEVKCAFYDLNLDYLIKTLKEKNAEIVLENKSSYALMHNKFCILDNEIVITGSMNPTENGVYKNNNNMIIIFSKYLADNYLREYKEIEKGIYGDGEETKYQKVYINNKLYKNYFCPEDECKEKILEELEKAKSSIHFMTFSFTDEEIADELIWQSRRIDVKGVMEERRINMNYNKFKYLVYHNVSVIPDSNPAVMHHKVFIIDNKTAILGSYNPTKSANERNDENILIINDERIAKKFIEEFERLL
jgi:phosphatidylserine/phosphatidylglycerophosphate/cardiolipin synthase-like enzyme